MLIDTLQTDTENRSYHYCRQLAAQTRRQPAGASDQTHLHLVGAVALLPLFVQVLDDALFDRLGRHVGHDPDGELARHLHGDDGLGAVLGEGAVNAVQRQRRVAPPGHQRLRLGHSHTEGAGAGHSSAARSHTHTGAVEKLPISTYTHRYSGETIDLWTNTKQLDKSFRVYLWFVFITNRC